MRVTLEEGVQEMIETEPNRFYTITRESVARAANSYHDKNSRHDKNQYLSLDSIYIIDISIYLDLPREKQTNRSTDCRLKEQSVCL